MTPARSDLLPILKERGFIQDMTDEAGAAELLGKDTVTVYAGFDCTAPSLHVGHLLPIMVLHWTQACGHRPIALMGGGTSRIGDPTGKDAMRKMLSDDDINANMASIKTTFDRFLKFGTGPSDAIMRDNHEWLSKLGYIEFLRDYGPHFTVNRMLTFESVKMRLEREQPLTFLEFNYMLFQAYDYLELLRQYDCRIQFGGSDQWGNIVNGVELCRRIEGTQVHGIVTPLLTTANGKKMGKTEGGAVWLNREQLPDYDFWQYWRNVDDADVGRFMKLFTKLPLDEIARLEALEGQEINEAKKILATEVTTLVRGREAADKAAQTAEETFAGGGMSADLPSVDVPRADLEAGIAAFQIFRTAGLAASGGEARRLIKGGGARVNDVALNDENQSISLNDLTGDGVIKLSSGKKKHVLVRPS